MQSAVIVKGQKSHTVLFLYLPNGQSYDEILGAVIPSYSPGRWVRNTQREQFHNCILSMLTSPLLLLSTLAGTVSAPLVSWSL